MDPSSDAVRLRDCTLGDLAFMLAWMRALDPDAFHLAHAARVRDQEAGGRPRGLYVIPSPRDV